MEYATGEEETVTREGEIRADCSVGSLGISTTGVINLPVSSSSPLWRLIRPPAADHLSYKADVSSLPTHVARRSKGVGGGWAKIVVGVPKGLPLPPPLACTVYIIHSIPVSTAKIFQKTSGTAPIEFDDFALSVGLTKIHQLQPAFIPRNAGTHRRERNHISGSSNSCSHNA